MSSRSSPSTTPSRRVLGGLGAAFLGALRRSCSVELVDDPRPGLRRAGRPYALALLHAHQLAALVANDEPALAAMLSRSPDGDLLEPSLHRAGVVAVRGSGRSGRRDKGGLEALDQLAGHLASGQPVLIAVDGPRGPRGHVHLGIAELAARCGAAVVPLVAVPSPRLRLRGSWDRFQIPLPWARVAVTFGGPLEPRPGERPAALRERIASELARLELAADPEEARLAARGTPLR